MMRTSTVSLCLLLLAAVAGATDRRGPSDPWTDLVEMLQQSGVAKTDAPSLIGWLRTAPPSANRWAAIEVLGLRGDREAIPVLRAFAADGKERFLAETAALALARLGDENGKSALVAFVESSKDPLRQLYLAARLAELGEVSGYRFVAQAAIDDSANRRFASAAALVAFVPLGPASKGAIDAERRLLALAHDEDAGVRLEFVVQAPIAVARGADRSRIESALRELAAKDSGTKVREQAQTMLTGLEFEDENKRREEQPPEAPRR